MQKSTIRRGALAGGIAGVAVIGALLAPGIANAETPEDVSGPVIVSPGHPGMPALPGGPDGEQVLVTKNPDGTVTVQRGDLSQLPPGAVPAQPIGPGVHVEQGPGVVIQQHPGHPGDHAVTVVPRATLPSTGSAG
ncbi:hypothetical protein [Nocardia sp. NPDC127526]|uniref:hypothetical protein n=1 Tax=Nocardia sp. NPDC127526 TaxID=3345393 RepID=UPI0036281978